MKRVFGLTIAASMLGCGAALAQVSDGVVKLGVLNDMSSLYADASGKGGVLAAQMAVEDFGGKVLGAPIEVISGDHQNKPDIGAGIARQWIDTDHVDAIVDVPTSSVALAIQEVTREKKRLFLMSGPASSDLTGKACSPYGFQWTYDTYALAHGTGGALVKQGGDSVVFHHRRLCLRPCPGARYRRCREGCRRHDTRVSARAAQHPGLLIVPAAGPSLQGEGHWVCQCWRRHYQFDQAGLRIRNCGWRPEARGAAHLPDRHPLARSEDRAGPDYHVSLVLGQR